MRFTSTIVGSGKTAAGIPVPDEVLDGLAGGKRPKVVVTVGDYTYRSSIGTVDGRPMLPISVENRTGAGVGVGDEVEVGIELDTAPRQVTVPDDLKAALDAEPAARAMFDSLTYSLRSYHVSQVEGTKNPETRQRRIEKAVTTLAAGRQR